MNWTFHESTTPKEVDERLKHQDFVISNKVVLNTQTLNKAKHLKLIQIAATGMNNVDVNAAISLGIPIKNVTDYCTHSVAQHVFSLILALTHHTAQYHQSIKQGDWHNSQHFCYLNEPIRDLDGLVIGIVGYGTLGKAVAKLAEAFGMQVLIAEGYNQTENNRLPLTALLQRVDILTLHCPLTEFNQHFINADQLSLMKPSALLINTARGGLVDEQALADALKNNLLGGAGIDVLEQEPPTTSPLLDPELENIILTPHIAWASKNARQRLLDKLTRNITQSIAGKP